MTQQETDPGLTHAPAPEAVPAEWMQELAAMPIGPERDEMEAAIRELGGIGLVSQVESPTIEQISQPEASAPRGYASMETVSDGATIDMKQFNGVVHSFADSRPEVETDVIKLVTDQGKPVEVVDLRKHMTASVVKNGPKELSLRKKLWGDVLKDVKTLAETGKGGKKVSDVAKVHYSSRTGTKARSYWMIGSHKNSDSGTPTVFVLADCDNSIASERDLYRRVFGKKM